MSHNCQDGFSQKWEENLGALHKIQESGILDIVSAP